MPVNYAKSVTTATGAPLIKAALNSARSVLGAISSTKRQKNVSYALLRYLDANHVIIIKRVPLRSTVTVAIIECISTKQNRLAKTVLIKYRIANNVGWITTILRKFNATSVATLNSLIERVRPALAALLSSAVVLNVTNHMIICNLLSVMIVVMLNTITHQLDYVRNALPRFQAALNVTETIQIFPIFIVKDANTRGSLMPVLIHVNSVILTLRIVKPAHLEEDMEKSNPLLTKKDTEEN